MATLPKPIPPITGVSHGEPVELSCLARLLLQLHNQPALRLVTDEQSSNPVPAELEGSE